MTVWEGGREYGSVGAGVWECRSVRVWE